MCSRGITWILLLGILFLGTGASTEAPQGGTFPDKNFMEAIQQAQEWKHAGDMAVANQQPLVAYGFYAKLASVFPATHYGRWAAKRVHRLQAHLKRPARSPGVEEPLIAEFFDMVTWP